MVSAHLGQGNTGLCLDHAFEYSAAYLLEASGKYHTEEHPADQLDQLQTVHILGLEEVFPCLVRSRRSEERYTAKEFAVAALMPGNEQIGLVVAAENVATAAHLLVPGSVMSHPLVVVVPVHHRCY